VSGIILGLIWIVLSILPALLESKAPPEAYFYTTFMTGIVDIGIVAPALLIAGALILRRAPLGYLLSSTMLVFTCILGPSLTAGGIIQIIEEVITVGQAMAFTVPFVILALIALVLSIRLFRSFSEASPRIHPVKHKKQNRLERYSTH
jgi:phosphate/sulfate permease